VSGSSSPLLNCLVSKSTTGRPLIARLRELRKRHSISQEQCSELAGISYKYYQMIEGGRRIDLRLSTLQKLATGYGIQVHELLAQKCLKLKSRRPFPQTPGQTLRRNQMKPSATPSIQKAVAELRQALRWTQKKAAEACNINPCLYQLYELGIKKNPGLLTLEKIANGFGIQVHELLAPVCFCLAPCWQTNRKHKSSPNGNPQE